MDKGLIQCTYTAKCIEFLHKTWASSIFPPTPHRLSHTGVCILSMQSTYSILLAPSSSWASSSCSPDWLALLFLSFLYPSLREKRELGRNNNGISIHRGGLVSRVLMEASYRRGCWGKKFHFSHYDDENRGLCSLSLSYYERISASYLRFKGVSGVAKSDQGFKNPSLSLSRSFLLSRSAIIFSGWNARSLISAGNNGGKIKIARGKSKTKQMPELWTTKFQ